MQMYSGCLSDLQRIQLPALMSAAVAWDATGLLGEEAFLTSLLGAFLVLSDVTASDA